MCCWNGNPRPGAGRHSLPGLPPSVPRRVLLLLTGQCLGVFRGEPRPCHTLHFADAVPGNRCLAQDSCLGARVHVRIAFSFLGFLSASFSALPSPSMVCPWSPTLPGKALVLSAAVTVLACAAIDVSVCPTPSTIRLHSVVNNWSSARSYCVQGMLSGSAAVRHNAYGHQL